MAPGQIKIDYHESSVKIEDESRLISKSKNLSQLPASSVIADEENFSFEGSTTAKKIQNKLEEVSVEQLSDSVPV